MLPNLFAIPSPSNRLFRVAVIDVSDRIDVNFDIPTPEEVEYVKGPYDSDKTEQDKKNNPRSKIGRVVTFECEVDEKNIPVANKPIVIGFVGINFSINGLALLEDGKNKIRETYLTMDNPNESIFTNEHLASGKVALKTAKVQEYFERVYYNAMNVAYNLPVLLNETVGMPLIETKGLACPRLSTGYYGGIFSRQIYSLLEETFNKAKNKFLSDFPHFASINKNITLTQDSRKSLSKLVTSDIKINQIALGIAGADNSGTGSIFMQETQNKIKSRAESSADNKTKDIAERNKITLPQEETVRAEILSGPFNVKENYLKINHFFYIDQDNKISLKNNLANKNAM
jgi:hypothetical protein